MRMSRGTRRREAGAVIVETALGLPVLLLFVFGLVDLGRWSLEANEAANAARDGARAGIFSYAQADDAGSADHQVIVEQVHARLQERSTSVAVDVSCVAVDDTVIDCSDAVADQDRIRVDVAWDLDLVTPVAGAVGRDSVTVDARSTMRLTGLPAADTTTPATTAPPPCALVAGPTATPTSVTATETGAPDSDVVIAFETNGSEACDALQVVLTASGGSHTHPCGCDPAPSHSWTYDAGAGLLPWTSGDDVTVAVVEDGASLGTTSITVS